MESVKRKSPDGTSRRSFLAAILGAISGSALPARSTKQEMLNELEELWGQSYTFPVGGPIYRPFYFWEKVPLDSARVEIVPPPLPAEMVVTGMGIHFEPQIPVATLREILKSWELSVRHKGKDALCARFQWFAGSMVPFAQGLRVLGSDNLRVELNGEPSECCTQVIFKGMVRL